MRWPGLLIGVATVGLVTALVRAQPSPASNGYTGSQSCQSCHAAAYDTWRRTLHVQMTKPIAEARVEGDFSPAAAFAQNGRSYTMERRDGRYFISVQRQKQRAEKFEVNYTLGARRFQGYLSKLPDGRIYVLPVFWHNESKRWLDYKEITPIPDDPDHDMRQIWNVTCVTCHATNLVKHYDVATNTYATTWTEMGIGCEACHGPGRPHIDDPQHKQIFSPNHAPARQTFDMCGYCHGNKTNSFFGFRPGDRYEDFAMPFLVSEPIPPNDPQGDFWPDGRPSRFNRPQALTLTGCFRSGQATCTSCHRMHAVSPNAHSLKVPVETADGKRTVESDQLCTQCHKNLGNSADLDRHTHHSPDSQGSRCIECHMSDVNWRLITRRRDHTFQSPVPEMTATYGVPNACTTCHEDKSPEWAAKTMDAWYGDGDRRRAVVAMADAMYRAGAGDVGALPDVARLAVDRSKGILIRASAAEFAGQLLERASQATPPQTPSPAVANALIAAASDPEPQVRAMAVRALVFVREPSVLQVLAARLADDARVVRVSAATSITALGVRALDGAAGQALARAEDEWAASLTTFDDVANDHTTLGWLDSARGRTDEAVRELMIAIRMDPSDAQPHVYLGVLAARAGKYAEALQQFKSAKALAPSYQNLDRLIDEAQKRAAIRR
jgi:hypothetical protein